MSGLLSFESNTRGINLNWIEPSRGKFSTFFLLKLVLWGEGWMEYVE